VCPSLSHPHLPTYGFKALKATREVPEKAGQRNRAQNREKDREKKKKKFTRHILKS